MTVTEPRPTIVPPPTQAPADGGTGPEIGRPRDRRDGPAKTTGTARFAADHEFAELAHAVVVHSSIARARITVIDTRAALAHPGVIAVLTHENTPRLRPPAKRVNPLDLSSMAAGTTVGYLNTDEIHFDGQPVAVVVGVSLDAAQEGAELVRPSYDVLPAEVDFDAAIPGATKVASSLPPIGGHKGDAEAALRTAPTSVDLAFSTPGYNHNAIEPHATTAVWDGDLLTVHEGSQNLDWTQKHLARRFGIPVEAVRVLSPYVGGGFGGKANVWAGTLLAVMAARATDRPVRLALSREGVYRVVGGRTPSRQRVALGAEADGRLTAVVHTCVTVNGRVGGSAEQVTSCSRDSYAAANILVQQRAVQLDRVPNTAMRAPGESIGSFALESAVDELAIKLGQDPLAFRLANDAGEVSPLDGTTFTHRRIPECLRLASERFGWAGRPLESRSMRDGKDWVGWGAAVSLHPAWKFPASVVLRVDRTGVVTLSSAMHEMGMGTATVQAQVVADVLGVPYEQVRVEYGDSSLPTAPGAGGSGQSASLVAGIEAAAKKLQRQLDKLAGAGRPGASYAEILAAAGRDHLEVRFGADRGLRATGAQARWLAGMVRDGRRLMRASSGAQMCEVRVDADTGEVRLTRWVGVFDIGRVLNSRTAASQLRGGIVMGIGLAMGEETLFDTRSGRIMNPSLAEYHVPVHADVPAIDITMLDDPDPSMPQGVLGAGEVGITGAAGAIANAVRHATGQRVCDLPITLDKVLPPDDA